MDCMGTTWGQHGAVWGLVTVGTVWGLHGDCRDCMGTVRGLVTI